jgi:ferredoxin
VTAPSGGRIFQIDKELCSGHGRCYSIAPESFAPDEFGYGVPNGRIEQDKVLSDLQFIADSCPEEAISIVEVAPVDARKESQ